GDAGVEAVGAESLRNAQHAVEARLQAGGTRGGSGHRAVLRGGIPGFGCPRGSEGLLSNLKVGFTAGEVDMSDTLGRAGVRRHRHLALIGLSALFVVACSRVPPGGEVAGGFGPSGSGEQAQGSGGQAATGQGTAAATAGTSGAAGAAGAPPSAAAAVAGGASGVQPGASWQGV